MSNPGGSFAATDVVILPGTPTRRLVFSGISDRYCLVHYEYGGIGHGYMTALFAYQEINRYLCGCIQAAGTTAWTSLPKKLTRANSRMR
jgi:hypothetical protein